MQDLGGRPARAANGRSSGGPAKNPVGRPPASNSVETRSRVLAAARVCFGRYGYDRTTNRHIADAAGITTGAIYHYFPSKQELFAATYREVQHVVLVKFREAAAAEKHVVGKIEAFLTAAVELHESDRSLAAFAAISPIELQHHPELQRLLGSDGAGSYFFFEELVAECAPELTSEVESTAVVNSLVACVLGLAQLAATSDTVETHRAATEALKRMINGSLFQPPAEK